MTDDERVALRAKIQAKLNRLIERGAPAAEVFEASFTVAIAGLAGVHGPRAAATSCLSTGAGLKLLADQADADAGAARH